MSSHSNFHLERKDWESNFFKREWGLLAWKGSNLTSSLQMNVNSIRTETEAILKKADKQFELIEFNATTELFSITPFLEEVGFRLVDSRISFVTLVNIESLKNQNFPLNFTQLRISDFSNDHLKEVVSLTNKFLTLNDGFISRFKNRLFFEPEDAERYFTTWVTNSLLSNDSISCVLLDDQKLVVGYFIYERKGMKEGIPIYKGILTVIDDRYRGNSTHLAMQSYLFSQIKESEFYIDNTTQLTNLPVIQNHIKSHRRLALISLTFFRKIGSNR